MIATTAAASIIAAAVAVLVVVAVVVRVVIAFNKVSEARRGRPVTFEDRLDEQYLAARRAMNDAAGQSWRNIIE